MHPLLEIPTVGIVLRAHNVLVFTGAIIALWLSHAAACRSGLDRWRVGLALLGIAAAVLIGGRLHFALAHRDSLPSTFSLMLGFRSAGMHAPGAVVGAFVGGLFVLWLLRLPSARFADCLAPVAGIGIAIARLGCAFHGCCFGIASDLPWAVRLPRSSSTFLAQVEEGLIPPGAEASLPVHPLPLYFSAAALLITALLLRMGARNRYDGQRALWFLALFSASSAVLELLRADDPFRVYWGPMPQLLWVTAGMSLVSLLLLVTAERRTWRAER